jgi:hypothetical protein
MPERVYAELTAIRQEMHALSGKILDKFEEHAKEDRLVADQVIGLVTREEEREKQANRSSAWIGILAAGGFSVFLKAMDRWLK